MTLCCPPLWWPFHLCCEMGLLDAMLTSLINTPSVTSLKKPYGKWFILKGFKWIMLHKHDLPCLSSILPFFSIIPAAFYIVIKLRLTERSSVWRLFIKAIIYLSKKMLIETRSVTSVIGEIKQQSPYRCQW